MSNMTRQYQYTSNPSSLEDFSSRCLLVLSLSRPLSSAEAFRPVQLRHRDEFLVNMYRVLRRAKQMMSIVQPRVAKHPGCRCHAAFCIFLQAVVPALLDVDKDLFPIDN